MNLHYAANTPIKDLIEDSLERSLNVAFWLLPSLLLIRCYSIYTTTALDEAPASALLNALALATTLLVVLVTYQELITMLDKLVHSLATYLGDTQDWEKHLRDAQKRLNAPHKSFIYRKTFSLLAGMRQVAAEFSHYVLRAVVMEFRIYFLTFSTIVGPLAIAAYILPGTPQNALAAWLNMHLATLFWGVTIAIIDMLMASVGTQSDTFSALGRDMISSMALLLMYLFVGPLTSIYVGNMAGNAFFSAAAGATTRVAATAGPKAIQIASALYYKMSKK